MRLCWCLCDCFCSIYSRELFLFYDRGCGELCWSPSPVFCGFLNLFYYYQRPIYVILCCTACRELCYFIFISVVLLSYFLWQGCGKLWFWKLTLTLDYHRCSQQHHRNRQHQRSHLERTKNQWKYDLNECKWAKRVLHVLWCNR